MTTSLGKRKGEWVLVDRDAASGRQNLIAGRQPTHETEQYQLWRGVFIWPKAPSDDLELYPVVKYRGMRLFPEWWHMEGTHPVLRMRVFADQIKGSVKEEDLAEALRRADQSGSEEDRRAWMLLASQADADSREAFERLVSEGWRVFDRGDLYRDFRLEELEALECTSQA